MADLAEEVVLEMREEDSTSPIDTEETEAVLVSIAQTAAAEERVRDESMRASLRQAAVVEEEALVRQLELELQGLYDLRALRAGAAVVAAAAAAVGALPSVVLGPSLPPPPPPPSQVPPADPTKEEIHTPIAEREKVTRAGALSQLSHLPDTTNAAHPEHFHKIVSILFKNVAEYNAKTTHMNELLADFQLHLMKQRFIALSEDNSPVVRGKSVHKWVWHTLKKLEKMPCRLRSSVYNHMVGDYKKYSLNPSGRRDPTTAQAAGSDE